LLDRAMARTHHLYILCDIATLFVQDGTCLRRDGEKRNAMHDRYRELLAGGAVPWIEMRGHRAARADQAVAAIEPLLRAGGVGNACPSISRLAESLTCCGTLSFW
jgi:hypothetical protein